jgi:hypothetical protein
MNNFVLGVGLLSPHGVGSGFNWGITFFESLFRTRQKTVFTLIFQIDFK